MVQLVGVVEHERGLHVGPKGNMPVRHAYTGPSRRCGGGFSPTTARMYLRLTWKCEVGAHLGLKRLIWG